MAQAKINQYSGTELISLAEAKQYLRIDFDDDDTYITDLIKIARVQVLKDTNQPVVEQVITEYFTKWPAYDIFYLQYAGKISGSVIKFHNTKGTITTYTAGTHYNVINYMGNNTIEMKETEDLEDRKDAIEVEYTIEPQTSDAVKPLKIAMFMLIQHFYDNRSPVAYVKVNEMPLAYKHIIQQFKNYTW
jgi:uncharacterized phiE125 gp8 family phage protein